MIDNTNMYTLNDLPTLIFDLKELIVKLENNVAEKETLEREMDIKLSFLNSIIKNLEVTQCCYQQYFDYLRGYNQTNVNNTVDETNYSRR